MCPSNISQITDLFNYATCLIGKSVIPLLFALAAAVFVWGVVNFFIIGAGEEAKRTQGKQFIIWGIIALAVVISVWGLVRMLGSTFVPGVNTRFLPGVVPSRVPASTSCPSGQTKCSDNVCRVSCPSVNGGFDCRLCSDPDTFDEYECTTTCGGN